jgi:hypothetical protein
MSSSIKFNMQGLISDFGNLHDSLASYQKIRAIEGEKVLNGARNPQNTTVLLATEYGISNAR